ncbi:hypothetical protein ACFPVT_01690 [Corynebacterium choanae]|uniref:Uncharacterized protein n=1 Tax=Corynebacterium choanae TaxID=1862358 RepID=A0A3G6J3S4_9CORY|nr:hypothetical protein [Corynebacterium choanae]AZA12579.1 hypothetical protein CCHOA_00750 [Corynebacterium choanae]
MSNYQSLAHVALAAQPHGQSGVCTALVMALKQLAGMGFAVTLGLGSAEGCTDKSTTLLPPDVPQDPTLAMSALLLVQPKVQLMDKPTAEQTTGLISAVNGAYS